jgi:hypothetical protein
LGLFFLFGCSACSATASGARLESTEDDHMWPSSLMARLVMQRFAANRHPHKDLHLDYPGAGHQVGRPAKGTPSGVLDFGGTLEANQKSFEDSWPRVLSFFQALTNPDPQASR